MQSKYRDKNPFNTFEIRPTIFKNSCVFKVHLEKNKDSKGYFGLPVCLEKFMKFSIPSGTKLESHIGTLFFLKVNNADQDSGAALQCVAYTVISSADVGGTVGSNWAKRTKYLAGETLS